VHGDILGCRESKAHLQPLYAEHRDGHFITRLDSLGALRAAVSVRSRT
jgi:hypothetical protein